MLQAKDYDAIKGTLPLSSSKYKLSFYYEPYF